MKLYHKIFLSLGLALITLLPGSLRAQDQASELGEKAFKAEVIEVIEERTLERENDSAVIQQNLRLRGLEGDWKNLEIVYYGISEIDVVSANYYRPGDRVFVQRAFDVDGQEVFYIHDYVREKFLYLLAAIFAVVTILVGRLKGLKALISLSASFLVIIKFILPRILSGGDPLLYGILGALLILILIIYLTEGWSKKAHIALASVFISLGATFVLASLFTALTHLTGSADEEVSFLIGVTKTAINFRGLLLAGIIIGTIGVLDDLIVGQIEATEQIREANSGLSKRQIFRLAYKVGNTHLGGMINTLFLVYAGASLPLLLLFTVGQADGLSYSQAINNELIATEIVRTLVGAIGVVLSMPIATFLGAYFLKVKRA